MNQARGADRRADHALDGVLVVDKPSGPTSHDVVARARIALKERRIGHTGTLDPLATGVLPLVIGRATRLARFFSGSTKTYEAAVRLGIVTDTYDVLGRVVAEPPVPAEALDPVRVEGALASFRQARVQTPPPFSAKKIAGARAYDLARQSEVVTLGPVPVRIERLDLVRIAADTLHLRLTVSAGFYVRRLAHDLGVALGTGGTLAALRRTQTSDFNLGHAVALEQLERDPQRAVDAVIPLDALLLAVPAVELTANGCARALHGAALKPDDVAAGLSWSEADAFLVRLMDGAGHLRAVARREGATLHPLVVLG